jgi:hypothetical protein
MAFRSIASAQAHTTSVAVAAPAGIADGDILICAVAYYDVNTHTISLPTGFTSYYAQGPLGTYHGWAIGWKRASSESGTYTASVDTYACAELDAYVAAYSGRLATGDPLTAGSNTKYETANTNIIAAGVTAAAGDDVIFFGGGRAGSAMTIAAPSGMNARAEYEDASNNFCSCLADLENVSAGATGNKTATTTVSINRKHGFLLSLAKATVVASSTPKRSGRFHIGPFSC